MNGRLLVQSLLPFIFCVAELNAEESIQALTTGTQFVEFPTRLVPVLPAVRRDTDTLSVDFAFSRFNTNLGTLEGVRIGFLSTIDPSYSATILTPTLAGMNVNMNCQHSLRPSGASPAITRNILFNQSGTFTVNPLVVSLTLDYAAQSIDTGFNDVSASTVPLYEGSGQVSIPLRIDFQEEEAISITGMIGKFQMNLNIVVALIYDFTPPPRILGFNLVDENNAILTWTAKPGSTYSLEAKDAIEAPWTSISNITAMVSIESALVPTGTNGRRFYRIGRIIP